ncbi:MAG TPA: hypothetical protein DIC64_01700 [Alphaproteobacteria bacterium]|nr:hypothetical protein [Alphaproteobacteria bacterium]
MISEAEKIKIFHTWGSMDEKVCYAVDRLEAMEVKPYQKSFKEHGDGFDFFKDACQQAAKEGQKVAVYLNSGEIKGLFVVTPDEQVNNEEHLRNKYKDYVKNQTKLRWDKPIEEQKKEEKSDQYTEKGYGLKLYKKWGVLSKEGQYAAERLEKLGIEHYEGKCSTDIRTMFGSVVDEATRKNKKVAVQLNSGALYGLFVVSPLKEGETKESKYDYFVANQKRLRWDKPIEQQKAEEATKSSPNKSIDRR